MKATLSAGACFQSQAVGHPTLLPQRAAGGSSAASQSTPVRRQQGQSLGSGAPSPAVVRTVHGRACASVCPLPVKQGAVTAPDIQSVPSIAKATSKVGPAVLPGASSRPMVAAPPAAVAMSRGIGGVLRAATMPDSQAPQSASCSMPAVRRGYPVGAAPRRYVAGNVMPTNATPFRCKVAAATSSASVPARMEARRHKMCVQAFPTAEEAKEHWMKTHWQTPSRETSEVLADADVSHQFDASQIQDSDQPTTRTVVKHVCPTCSEEFLSLAEVRDHWLREHATGCAEPEGDDGIKTVGTDLQSKDAVQVVSCDDAGRAQVLRQMDDDGSKYTVVMNDDGSKEIFTETRVVSLASMEEDDVAQWLRDVTNLHLKGFVHEATQRVVEGSQTYHSRRANLQKLGDRINFAYFGLDANATEKELEGKYRQLAKKMHPDKNGGTETAKDRFQMMKRRYEQLKERLREGVQGDSLPDGQEPQAGTAASNGEDDDADIAKEEQEEVLLLQDTDSDVIGFKRLGDCLLAMRAEDSMEAEPAHIVALSIHDENGELILCAVDSRGVELRCCVSVPQRESLEAMWSRCKPEQAKTSNHRREAYDEDEEPTAGAEEDEADMLRCDYSSRDSMEKMAWRMLRQLKSIKTQMDILDSEFKRFESVAPA
mmetsp:Transcript_51089/g.119606  ORF Transcript_51089/g.119606 Transcript_51089/m.119606 type:complete len:655 (-) Transcript_51089:52-2016(-)